MVEHIVLFKFNDQYTEEIEAALLAKLQSFKTEIAGIVELTAGRNDTQETDRAQGYALGLRITFESQQALDDYLPHPVHRQFGQMLQGIMDDVIVVDYPVHK